MSPIAVICSLCLLLATVQISAAYVWLRVILLESKTLS